MNDQDIVTCADQAAAWLLDRRERLEKYEHESTALLWLSVSEIEAIIGSFDTLEAALVPAGSATFANRSAQDVRVLHLTAPA